MEISDKGLMSEIERSLMGWAKVYTGRPRWDRIFRKVRAEAEAGPPPAPAAAQDGVGAPVQAEVGVFLCGPAAIGKQLKAQARKHTTKQTLFVFKTEHF